MVGGVLDTMLKKYRRTLLILIAMAYPVQSQPVAIMRLHLVLLESEAVFSHDFVNGFVAVGGGEERGEEVGVDILFKFRECVWEVGGRIGMDEREEGSAEKEQVFLSHFFIRKIFIFFSCRKLDDK